jgi:aldose 1-epimerase
MTMFAFASCKPAKDSTGFYTLTNSSGMTATFTAYGGRLVSLSVPDKNGKATNVVWGFGSTSAYEQCATDPYYGAIIGRYGNRIGSAKFRLGGKVYKLDPNDHRNSLHGGAAGFHTKTWQVQKTGNTTIVFSYISPDGQGGYPGNLLVKVTYTLTADNALQISYEATTDKPTVINLTNHTYWNLNGPGSGTILRHQLRIRADGYTPVDSSLIPTGIIDSVQGTPFDFRNARVIGVRIGDHDAQLQNGKGYDHNFVLSAHGKKTAVAEVLGDRSGIRMKIYTDQPGLQFYSGNFMTGKNAMNGGEPDSYRGGFCLETQHFPDSPNKPWFPSTVLRPGQTYRSQTIYQFSAE